MQLIAATVTVTTHARHQTPVYVLQDGQEVTAQKVFTSSIIEDMFYTCAAICLYIILGMQCYASNRSPL